MSIVLNEKEQTVSIYALINPIDNSVFYIGCTHSPWERLIQHITQSKNCDSYKSTVIQEIKSTGHDVEMLVLDKCHISQASFWEEFYMQLYKSYGFTLKQSPVSTYTDTFKDRKFLAPNVPLSISKDIVDYIRGLAKDINIGATSNNSIEFLLKCAIKEFMDKCKVRLDVPFKNEYEKLCNLRLLWDDLRKDHPYFG